MEDLIGERTAKTLRSPFWQRKKMTLRQLPRKFHPVLRGLLAWTNAFCAGYLASKVHV